MIEFGPESVKGADKTKSSGRRKTLHPAMQVKEVTKEFRASSYDRNGARQNTHPSQAFYGSG